MSNIGNKETFSKNLKYYLDRSGRTQVEIAENIGVSKGAITEWLKGRKYPRIDKIEMLANYFGIQKSDLIEERLTEEKEKDNDDITNAIVRMRMNDNFLDVVNSLYKLDDDKLELVRQFLHALSK